MRTTKFNKAIVSGIALILNTVVASMSDDTIDMTDKQHIITTVLTVALGVFVVWRTPNAKDTPPADVPTTDTATSDTPTA